MRVIDQSLDDILANLSPLDVEWMDDEASAAIAKLADLPHKVRYDAADIALLFDGPFNTAILCARLFLAKSKDKMEEDLRRALGPGGSGARRYAADPDAYYIALDAMGLPVAMTKAVNYQPVWSDILVERLRSGRGSAIQGQKRGRGLEDFAEALVKEVFGEGGYQTRCTFTGAAGESAKCDMAIPDKLRPRILIEVKGYGATGSKMTDIIGDLDAIIAAKRHDTTLLFVTDGTTWEQRTSDLRKIVSRQNEGKIARIYTTKMRDAFVDDLRTLKAEADL
ncbi:DpnII family type II restriction endonuclease [Sphingomonas sp. LHG3406-1]|uniref:DpnII family type II restriction endonuclease n=1 Tax=Sphingomonas sp. LHG3406-1 TaxID=2804617 RepID=UPI00261358FA|nr:DpnII family type II restriction endonuclease [Sphingomonas sp. LHG3406-1]